MSNDIPDWTAQAKVNLVGGVSGLNLGDTGAPVLAADAGTENVSTTGGPVLSVVGLIASFKAAAGLSIAPVSNPGALAVGTNLQVSPAFGQATVAGHLLAAYVTASQAIPTTAAAGWVQVVQGAADSRVDGAIWIKPNCGAAEAAPVFTCIGGTAPMAAQLIEFSGVAAAAPGDQSAFSGGVTNTVTVSNPAPDLAFGDLVLFLSCWIWTNPATAAFSRTLNNGGSLSAVGDTGATPATRGSSFSFGVVPAATVVQPLGVANWAYDAVGFNIPAVGTIPSLVFAAVPGKTYTLAAIFASLAANAAAADRAQVEILDGANQIFSHVLAVPAGIDNGAQFGQSGLAYKGTPGNSMTVKFGGIGAASQGAVSAAAYLR